jgi:hypothetical protein
MHEKKWTHELVSPAIKVSDQEWHDGVTWIKQSRKSSFALSIFSLSSPLDLKPSSDHTRNT